MGAWGEGMQANDTALDAIGSAGLSCGEPRKRAKTLKELRGGKKTVKSLFAGRTWIKMDPQAVLGLAEYLFDEGFDVAPVRELVAKATKNQLSKAELARWVDRDERKAALLRFKDRLDGKEVPKELLERDNEGLLSRISKVFVP
jgi:hypothetical protein